MNRIMTIENMFDSGLIFQNNMDPFLIIELTKLNQVVASRNIEPINNVVESGSFE
jgi:hypothetical protein